MAKENNNQDDLNANDMGDSENSGNVHGKTSGNENSGKCAIKIIVQLSQSS
jgi:hypothetical protein